MSRWTAPSDLDYWDEIEGQFLRGLEVPCRGCGQPVTLTREDRGLIHLFCETCSRRETEYQAALQDARRI